MAEQTLGQELAAFAERSYRDGVPAEVARSVRRRVLDTVGIAIAATGLDTSRAMLGYVAEQGGRPQAHAIGLPGPVPAPLAALANGTLAHSLDYDDTHLPSVLHPSASVVPAALAAAELAGADGAAVIRAAAVGLEICVRLGMGGYDADTGNSLFFDRGQHATSICGAVGGAAAAALLTGADAAGVLHAMGLSVSMSGGVIEANRTGGTVKRMHCGWAAHAAVTAAALAARGFTGPPTVFEGRFGFYRAWLDGRFDEAAVRGGLGTRWEVPRIFFKPYPANHFTHTAADAAFALAARGVRLAEVSSLRLGVAEPTVRTIGEPIETKRRPATGYAAQFSGPYVVVAGLLGGGGGLGLGLDDFTDARATDPGLREHMAKVTVVSDPDCTAVFPHQFPAVLTARTRDGREWTERVMANRGGPDRPLDDAELARKFTDNAARRLDPEAVESVRAAIETLDRQPAVGPILAGTGAAGAVGEE